MIIRFGVSNWRSIKDYQELLLTGSKVDNGEIDLIETSAVKENLLPAVVIYGGNASGKSNVLDAFRFFRSGILKSSKIKGDNDEKKVGCHPFLLDKESRDLPTRMDCDFIIDEIRYHYGIEVKRSGVQEEWLYTYPSGQRQVWFHRNASEDEEYYFGRMLKGKNKTIADLTRKDSLFICHAAENNHKQLTDIHKYFKNQVKLHLSQGIIAAHEVEEEFKDEGLKNQVMMFIRSVDTGIVDAVVEQDEDFFDMLGDDFKETMRSLIKSRSPDEDIDETRLNKAFEKISKEISFSHETVDGSVEMLPFSCESRGTQHLISLLIPIFKTLNSGGTIFVDEIDTSLHPFLSLTLVKLFLTKKSNQHNAQLIFTTHDTTLLAGSNMRRDQIWFTEKVAGGVTKFYPLTDYKLRPADNKEKAYLQGRVGGVPIITDINSLAEALMGGENVS